MVADVQTGSVRDYPAYLHFTPRPDQPERFDEQTSFYESDCTGVVFLLGGNGAGTTSCLIAKICRFVIETPPPRRDTPFWVIAESFSQCMSMYDEKFDQQGHLPPHVIDRDRIQWYKSNNNWPFRVPLKSPPGSPGKNWCLEFKSWRQGRGQMQARSLGGFGFIEQFPWGVFEECLRGCREYNFPGSKLIEYTPVDPDMSLDIEEMLENGPEPAEGKQLGLRYLPSNWKVYHANTLCAAEAGHVDMEWFKEFFGMVPAEMLDTRMKGLFSTFEGVIYKEFNTDIHCMGDEMWPRIRYCQHRRGIDWGSGPENDFACKWGARNGLGQWFIYDEYVSHDQLHTTIDHLTEVHDQWEWPEDDDHYGTTYADPSSPDNIRIACKMNRYTDGKIDNFTMQRGMNSVLEGIEHIQYLLKPQVPVPVFAPDGSPIMDEDGEQLVKLEPKLFIHRKNCPKLVQQMKTYRWLRGSDPSAKLSANPQSPKRAPLKKNDHCCLAGYVKIAMADGSTKPINEIQIGDIVLSHRGPSKVVASNYTGYRKVSSFQGTSEVILCTDEHPWYDFTRQVYCPLNEVQTLCKLHSTQIDQEHLSKLLTGEDTSGDDTQIQNIIRFVATSDAVQDPEQKENSVTCGCIKKSGNQSTEKFQPDTTSTTLTKIPQTTVLTTCAQSKSQNTASCTKTILKKQGLHQKTGMEAKRVESGIENTEEKSQQRQNRTTKHAIIAEQPTQQLHGQEITDNCCIALENAEPMPEKQPKRITNHDHALSAADRSSLINTQRSLPVLQSVEAFECRHLQSNAGFAKVYNIATEDGTYFADGILSSNCDALRYMCFSDDFMSNSTISSARSGSGIATSVSGHYLPTGDIRSHHTEHRDRN